MQRLVVNCVSRLTASLPDLHSLTLTGGHPSLIGTLHHAFTGQAEAALADVLRYPRVKSALARAAQCACSSGPRCARSVLPGTPVIFGLRDGLKMRGFQAAAVHAGATADARRVPVMTEVIDMLTGFKRTDGQHEYQSVTQQGLTLVSDTAISCLDGDSTLPDQAAVRCAYATCVNTLKRSHRGTVSHIREYAK